MDNLKSTMLKNGFNVELANIMNYYNNIDVDVEIVKKSHKRVLEFFEKKVEQYPNRKDYLLAKNKLVSMKFE